MLVNVLSDALIVDCSSDDRQSNLEFLKYCRHA